MDQYEENLSNKLKNIGLTQEQIDEAITICKHVALDALYDSKVANWAWTSIEKPADELP